MRYSYRLIYYNNSGLKFLMKNSTPVCPVTHKISLPEYCCDIKPTGKRAAGIALIVGMSKIIPFYAFFLLLIVAIAPVPLCFILYGG